MKNNRFMNVLLKAKEENIAVGAVNIFNYLTAEAAVKAAEEIGVNLIIQTSAGTVEHFGAYDPIEYFDLGIGGMIGKKERKPFECGSFNVIPFYLPHTTKDKDTGEIIPCPNFGYFIQHKEI